ncbi:hypothetical protein [Kaarinaea lacus]
MDIYIGNLPNQVNSSDLKKVVNTVLLPNNFRELIQQLVHRKDRVTFSEFDVVESQLGGGARFARGVIMPDTVARRLLSRMDHLTFQGKSLRVREFSQRDKANDRRRKTTQNLYAVTIYNRRSKERRLESRN